MWHRRKVPMKMRTLVGVIELKVWYGKDPQTGRWGCPMRERWGLSAHQQMSPALEERAAFMATVTFSYEAASRAMRKWGCWIDASVIHAVVQRWGKKAEEKTKRELQGPPAEKESQRAATELGVLMIDGWYGRFRGEGWGKKKTKKERVKWHEIKSGLFYRQEQVGRNANDRGVVSGKAVVRWEAESLEFGQRLDWQAQRCGLSRAKNLLALGDGAHWIWNLVQDRWSQAQQALDFWHGSQHLWELGRAYCADEVQSKQWVEKRLHWIRHGKEKTVLRELAELKVPRGQRGKVVRKEQNYFAGHAQRMHYQALSERGWPIGSGAIESQCNQAQGRFKRSGQFWTRQGFRHLSALDEAWLNERWDQLWLSA